MIPYNLSSMGQDHPSVPGRTELSFHKTRMGQVLGTGSKLWQLDMVLFCRCPHVAVLPLPCTSPKPCCWLHTWCGVWKWCGIARVIQALHSGAMSCHQAMSCWRRRGATKRWLNKRRDVDNKYSGNQYEQDCMVTDLRPCKCPSGWLAD